MMDVRQIRSRFSILSRKVYGKDLVYFDNAATSQRPDVVVSKQRELAEVSNANIHRAVHRLALEATEEYENTRDFIKDYIGADSREEIVFTSGTTASINLVAFSFGEAFVHEGDEIIVTEAEHHSNIVPWQMLCQRKGATLKVLPVDEDGYLRIDQLEGLIGEKTRLMAVSHLSNVLGLVNPVAEIAQICHSHGVKVLVDGAQGVVHQGVNVKNLGCDFYAFSGHKIFASTGTGVLYGKKELLEEMPPFMGGGEMIQTVTFEKTTYAPLPGKFEAGTQNINAVPTLKTALEFAKEIGEGEMPAISDYLLDSFSKDSRIRLFGNPRRREDKAPVFSFAMDGIHHEDLALILDKMGIAVRSGQMCAEPLMDRFGVTGMVRVSLAPYNTMAEAEYFIKCLDKAAKMLA